MFSSVTSGGAAGEGAGQRRLEGAHDVRDRQCQRTDAEARGQRQRIVDAALAGKGRRHQHSEDVIAAERFRRNDGGQRRVDAAGEPEQHVAEAALARIVGGAEHECAEDLFCAGDVRRHHVGGRRVEIDDDDRLAESRRPRHDAAIRIEDHAAAVEDQVVVAADLVHVGDVHPMAAGEHAEHLLAHRLLAGRERRRRQVDEDAGAEALDGVDRIGQVARPLPEVAVVPDVLTNADRGAHPRHLERLEAGARLEVAILVEDVVGRQQALDEDAIDDAVPEQRGGVRKRPSRVRRVLDRQADEDRRLPGEIARQLSGDLAGAGDERGLEQQVAGGIARQRHLRRDEQVGPGRTGHGRADPLGVAAQVADGRIDLHEPDAHTEMLSGRPGRGLSARRRRALPRCSSRC